MAKKVVKETIHAKGFDISIYKAQQQSTTSIGATAPLGCG